MHRIQIAVVFFAAVAAAIAQTDRGTITGTILDPAGAVVSGASIEVKNVANGQVYSGASTQTGNYTMGQLPPGSYELNVNVQGFKKYTRTGLDLAPTQVMRIDVALEVGSSAEQITVHAEASLLQTETGDVSQTVTGQRINDLPLLGIGERTASSSGIRNPWALALIVPGIEYSVGGLFGGLPNVVTNGTEVNSARYRIDGLDSTLAGQIGQYSMLLQPSSEAIQEVAVQTSNFAAEFGATGGGVFNATMRSGTNQWHGSAYDYNVNEAYNSRQPYTGLLTRARRNDYGGSLGGPVQIPKLYDGRNKTFFFFNFEEYRETQVVPTATLTVPIQDYRNGDFSKVITASGNQFVKQGAANYVDPSGRTILAGTIFDPATTGPVTVGGVTTLVRDPFPGNIIPAARFDKVALAVQKLIPPPTGPNAGSIGNNYNNPQKSPRVSDIPSIKLDQTVGGKGHLSFYWSGNSTSNPYPSIGVPGGLDGLPPTITSVIGNYNNSYTVRLNYDHALSPTLLLHVGAGYVHQALTDDTPVTNFDAFKELGLKGGTAARNFPTFNIGSSPITGGMANMGPGFQTGQGLQKPGGNVSLAWGRGNHSYKIGGEFFLDGVMETANANPPWTTAGSIGTNASATTQTALQTVNTTGAVGFGYASFLLGQVTSYAVGIPVQFRLGRHQVALFAQDTWKVTRKLTVNYGLRWDYGSYSRDTYGRVPSFSPTLANPTADGHLGAVNFEAACKCNFTHSYPYAIGPRLSVAYQLNSKTVFRAGFGVVYNVSGTGQALGGPITYQALQNPAFGQSFFNLQDGPPASINPAVSFNPGALPSIKGTVGNAPGFIDPNSGRPARQVQWSVGFQREVGRNLIVDASYVGNRGVWWSGQFGYQLAPNNSMSPQLLAHYGFTVGNLADAAILTAPLGSQLSQLATRGIGLPYSSFPTNQTVLQSLLPFPQYNGNISPIAPLGKTWYDSLQTSVTQRFSHGLTVNGNFVWSKNLDLLSTPDLFNYNLGKNLSGNDLPFQFHLSAQYITPKTSFFTSKIVSSVLADWTVGVFLQYQSAPVIARPASAGAHPISQWLGRGPGPAEYVAGQPLFSTDWTDLNGVHHTDELDINCHCFDPTKTIVLNPNAWANVPDGQWSSNMSSFRNFRGFRYPSENANFGRTFRIKERVTFNIRAEFTNIFNRTRLPQPGSSSQPGSPGFAIKPTTNLSGTFAGLYSGGFGTVVPTGGTQGARTGMLVGRITF